MFIQRLALVHVFPRLVPVAYFPALGPGCVFSRAWRRSRAWYSLRAFPRLAHAVFPHLAQVACFPALIGSLTRMARFDYEPARFPTITRKLLQSLLI